jgi:hypothetical protein
MFACTYNVADQSCAEDSLLPMIASWLIVLTAAVFFVSSCRLYRKIYLCKGSDDHRLVV